MTVFISFVVAGVVMGSVYAVTASGLVVTYNATGIFNIAHGAVGMFMAYLYWQLWQGWGWNPVLSLALVIFVIAPIFALVVERALMRPLYGASLNTMIGVTLGLFLVLFGVTSTLWNQITTRNLPDWFPNDQVSVLGVNLTYEELITVGAAVAVAIGLWVLFRHTRLGVSIRAVVDDPSLASLTGARTNRISGVAWMIGFMLAGLAGVLQAPGTGMSIAILSELVIFGYAAAIVGRLRSLPLTFLGAMILGVGESLAVGYVPANLLNDVTAIMPMGLLILALLILPQAKLATARVIRIRPPKVASRTVTLVGGVLVVAVAVVLSSVTTGNNLFTVGQALVIGLAALSLVVLSGYGGQVWLCQFTFLGLGAWAMSKIDGGSSVLGVLAAIGLCAAAGGILALPALRLRGLYMALATLAFAALMDSIFFTNPSIIPNGSMTVGRPDIFGMRFTTDRAFVVLIAIVFALCLIGVGALRRGRFGRRLVAMSDSPAACATVGMSLTRTKLAVFILGGGMAGLAGALYGGMSRTVSYSQFSFVESLLLFVAVALAGITILSGAVQAGIGLSLLPLIATHIPSVAGFTDILIGAGIVAVGRNPYGIGLLYSRLARGGMLKGPAQLRAVVVVVVVVRRTACPSASTAPHHPRRCRPLADLAPTSGPAPALMVDNVSVRFGGLQALHLVTLEVAPGEIHGLIGPNGAGKTTLFNVITGLQRPTHGRVHLGAHDVTSLRPHVRSRLGLGRTFQRLELFGTLTARENVQVAAEVQPRGLSAGRSPAEEADYQLGRVGILHVADEPTDSLPTGLARLVEVARALATSPSVLLLDEPSSGLNAEETEGLGEVLVQLASDGMGVLLVEHDMALVMAICARVDVLDNGEVIARGDPNSVRANPLVQEAYLGAETDMAEEAGAPSPKARVNAPAVAPAPASGAVSSTSPEVALSATDVRAAYGRIEVLHGISFEVPKGSSLALLGPNGAGKTTLLKAISGQLALTGGSVAVGGRPLGRNATERLARSGVCMIPEGRSIFPNLTVSENLLMYTFRRKGLKSAWVEGRAMERFPVLASRRKQLAGTLSGGEQRMLSMARALTTDPQILLLDELSMGLAPLIVEELYGVVGQLVASEQLTIIMVEQFVQTALSFADYAAIMVNGELVKRGTPAEIRSDVVGAYLGAESAASP